MQKISTERTRHALSGPAMGARWSALFFSPPGRDPVPIQKALQKSADNVESQMSVWLPDSNLMRLNQAPVGEPIPIPDSLAKVIALGLAIGRASDGVFDIGTGDAVRAWGFGQTPLDLQAIRTVMSRPRRPAYEVLELEKRHIRKLAPVSLDLNGIAKGFGVDQLAETLRSFDIDAGLVGINGEMYAFGQRPDGNDWTIAIEVPDVNCRAVHSVLSLQDAAVATSGDYRRRVKVKEGYFSHTMIPHRGIPIMSSHTSVTVIAPTCAEADAWATALMVTGPDTGARLVSRYGLSALFLMRDGNGGVSSRGYGAFFNG